MASSNENSDNKYQWSYGKQHECNTVMEINDYSSWCSSNSVVKGSPFEVGDSNFHIGVVMVTNSRDPHLKTRLVLLSNGPVDVELEVISINLKKTDSKARLSISTGYEVAVSIPKHFILSNEQLTLRCKITIFNLTMLGEQRNRFIVPNSSLVDNLNDLLESGESTDVILTCEGEQFKAHKSILAARSPVFAVMFKHDLKEQNHAVVDIVDMDKDVLKEMLKYMYTDKTGDLDKIANGLLAAADKYALERLRIMCEQSLATRLTIENAADKLILADAHSDDQLKEQTIQFIKGHKGQVIKTAGWKRMIKERVHLILKTFELIEN